MKKTITSLIALLTLVVISSCERKEGENLYTDYPASESEIQGSWEMEKNGTYFDFTFINGYYELTVTNVFSEGFKPHTEQSGTYTMEGNKIEFHVDGDERPYYSPLEAYWRDANGSALNLIPMGTFRRK